MGLDTSHGAWHGGYIRFHRWRTAVARAAGLPPLDHMEGFGGLDGDRRPPVRWSSLPPDPLHELLSHSDCDGEIAPDRCGPIADSLERLLPALTPEWAEETRQFVAGLRAAAAAGEPLDFH